MHVIFNGKLVKFEKFNLIFEYGIICLIFLKFFDIKKMCTIN